MNIRKFISFRLFIMLLMLCIASCSLNKNSLLNDNKADNNYAKHLAHSGKFGRCSLCNNLALASQSTDSTVMPLAVQPEEQVQIFASNATQDNIILKPSKYNFEESFENSSSLKKNYIKEENIKNRKYFDSLKPAIKPFNVEKKTIFLGIALAAIISSIFFLEVVGVFISLIAIPLVMAYYNYSDGTKKVVKNKKSKWARLGFFIALLILGLVINPELTVNIFFTSLILSPLIYGLYKLFELLFQAIKETPKKKKIYWLLVPILILPALFVLYVLLPILVLLSPLAIIYVTYRIIRNRKKEKSAAKKLGRLTLVAVLLGLLALAIFVPWFFTLFF